MRIEKDQLIGGLLARDVRRFMRQAACFIIGPRTVTNVFGFSEGDACQLLRKFQKEGLVTVKGDHWEATAKGHALAIATAASPLRRATAERLIAEVVERARIINADSEFAYCVQRLVVFGSFVNGSQRPNDIDVACTLVARFDGEKQRALEDERRGEQGMV